MGSGIVIQGLDAVLKKLDVNQFENDIQLALNDFGQRVVRQAKLNAPKDEGRLAQSINTTPAKLSVTVDVNVNYAAYVEFGTRKFAATYVAGLPEDWKTFAAQFKGKSNSGDVFDFIKILMGWVKRKGISGTYSVKTKKRTGAKAGRDNEDFEVAYSIALYILRNGIKPKPYLYPAIQKETPILIKDLENILT